MVMTPEDKREARRVSAAKYYAANKDKAAAYYVANADKKRDALHVLSNLQILERSANRRKSNKFAEVTI